MSATRVPADPTIVVTRRWPTEVERALREQYPSARLSIEDKALGPDGLRRALQYADIVLPTVTDRITADMFANGVRTRLLGNFGAGVDHIDLEAARRAGVVVTNTPGVLTESTADLALTLMLMVSRRVREGDAEIRSGAWSGWRPTHLLGTDLRGATLGVVGLGRIGTAVARRAAAFGMRIVYVRGSRTGSSPAEPVDVDVHECGTLDELLAQADVVSLHAPGGGANRHLIDERRLKAMKSTAILVNTGRGDLVDTDALVDALATRRIAGAGLDVFEDEPNIPDTLLGLANVVLLPHLGSATERTRIDMGRLVLRNLRAFLDGGTPSCRVT